MEKEVEKVEVSKKSNPNTVNEGSNRSLMDFIRRHWLSIVTILYIISPIDFIPDFIPVAGTADDLIVLAYGLYKEYQNYKKPDQFETYPK